MAAPILERTSLAMSRKLLYQPRFTSCFIQSQRAFDGYRKTESFDDRNRNVKKGEKDFRLLKIRPTEEDMQQFKTREQRKKERPKRTYLSKRPRYMSMDTDQDWTNVWPAAKTFNWSSVPLPVRQGVVWKLSEGGGDFLPLEKKNNLELMKIPNFLHLSPNHIRKHCAALKAYCTEWPKELNSEESVSYHFPMEVITSDYCFSGPSVRDPRARTVTVKFKLTELDLDKHAQDKFLHLVGDRYNPKTGIITITSDRCPIKKQNFDYIQYLITALYFESWKEQPWEKDVTEADMLEYSWDMDQRKTKITSLLKAGKEGDKVEDTPTKLDYLPEEVSEESIASLDEVEKYGKAVEEIYNTGENYQTISDYKKAVMDMLNVKPKDNTTTETRDG